MKCSISLVLICALVATALAETPVHAQAKKAAGHPGLARKSHEAREAHAQKAQHVAESRKAEHNPTSKVSADDNESVEDLKKVARAAVNTFTPLARQGARLAVDAAKSALGMQKSRSSGNLQKRAVKLASDSVSAVRTIAPTLARVASDALPSLVATARSVIATFTQ